MQRGRTIALGRDFLPFETGHIITKKQMSFSIRCILGWHAPRVVAVSNTFEYWTEDTLSIVSAMLELNKHRVMYALCKCNRCAGHVVYSSHMGMLGGYRDWKFNKMPPADIGDKEDCYGKPLHWVKCVPGWNLIYDPFTGVEYPYDPKWNVMDHSTTPKEEKYEL